MAGTYWNSSDHAYLMDSNNEFHLSYNKLRAILCAVWLGAIIPIGIAYYIFSSDQQRKSNLFKVQLFSIFLAIFFNTSEVALQVFYFNSLFLRSDKRMNWVLFSIWQALGGTLDHFIPLVADCALLFRLSAFFPFPLYSKKYRFWILGPFFITIFFRILLCIVNLISGICSYSIGIKWDSSSPLPWNYAPYWTWSVLEYTGMANNALSSLFCLAASIILLKRAHKLARSRISTSKNRIQMKMKFLTEALMMCFIPPLILTIAAQIQLLWKWNRYMYYRETQTLNVNLSVIFSLLATSWSSIRENMSTETQLRTDTMVKISNSP